MFNICRFSLMQFKIYVNKTASKIIIMNEINQIKFEMTIEDLTRLFLTKNFLFYSQLLSSRSASRFLPSFEWFYFLISHRNKKNNREVFLECLISRLKKFSNQAINLNCIYFSVNFKQIEERSRDTSGCNWIYSTYKTVINGWVNFSDTFCI